MRLSGKLGRIEKQLGQGRPGCGPPTVFLVEGPPGAPTSRRELWGGAAVEVVYDPTAGPPSLPSGGPHKLIVGGPAGLADRM
ncbi:MAG TPA: hypothetical protein VFG68_21765 [Fimbriiglobus sp.]|nr:hypothetical protein [Fimbriiglobus sp.]